VSYFSNPGSIHESLQSLQSSQTAVVKRHFSNSTNGSICIQRYCRVLCPFYHRSLSPHPNDHEKIRGTRSYISVGTRAQGTVLPLITAFYALWQIVVRVLAREDTHWELVTAAILIAASRTHGSEFDDLMTEIVQKRKGAIAGVKNLSFVDCLWQLLSRCFITRRYDEQ